MTVENESKFVLFALIDLEIVLEENWLMDSSEISLAKKFLEDGFEHLRTGNVLEAKSAIAQILDLTIGKI